ncbi:DUF2147 domain-containing protein [uncultured Polaribacter sp.]|uniref:DUF2147 domain-containing protein n=1 Tax=uncultured Polaribacter sp. TaxID=174711 RepID=UPI0026157B97|nr:DUF2147 domain-containing protein [uncultured Polaribacter sp.]
MKKTLITLVLITFAFSLNAQTILGNWKTVDDETGETKSIVKIYEENGKIYGKVVKVLNKDRQNAVCDKCEGAKKDKLILGMVIIEGLKKKNDEYKGGTILDPQKGKEYDCKIWLDEDDSNKLNVRGYISFLYRTQNWYRAEE